jgi:hypothetical protein
MFKTRGEGGWPGYLIDSGIKSHEQGISLKKRQDEIFQRIMLQVAYAEAPGLRDLFPAVRS